MSSAQRLSGSKNVAPDTESTLEFEAFFASEHVVSAEFDFEAELKGIDGPQLLYPPTRAIVAFAESGSATCIAGPLEPKMRRGDP